MVSKWKITAVWLAAAAVLFMGGCSGKSTAAAGKAAETTAAAEARAGTAAPGAAAGGAGTAAAGSAASETGTAAAADRAMAPAAESEKEKKEGPAAEAAYESPEHGPGAEMEAGTESGDKDIEAFAELIQEAVADKDMEALAGLASFPLRLETADGESFAFENREEFLKQNPDLIFGDDLMMVIAGIDTATLEPDGDTVAMGEEGPCIRYEKTEDGSFAITDIRE